MRLIAKLSVLLFLLMQFAWCMCFAQEKSAVQANNQVKNVQQAAGIDTPTEPEIKPFLGRVKEGNVNIRSDSTTNSEIICKVEKNSEVEVLSALYDWYKVKLPSQAPSFINKEFLEVMQGQAAKILNDNVNIRLRPDTASPILGRVNRDDTVNVLEDMGEWYRIAPASNSFGWIHKSLVRKAEKKKVKPVAQKPVEVNQITVEGLIKPKTITRVATHKLIAPDEKLYLLKSSKQDLSPFNSRKVKITGIVDDPSKQNPIIEVDKIEALD